MDALFRDGLISRHCRKPPCAQNSSRQRRRKGADERDRGGGFKSWSNVTGRSHQLYFVHSYFIAIDEVTTYDIYDNMVLTCLTISCLILRAAARQKQSSRHSDTLSLERSQAMA